MMTTIGAHCTVTSSKRFHLSDRADQGIPFYCSKQIIQIENGEEPTDYDFIKPEYYEEVREKYGVPIAGDLLITTRGTYGIPHVYRENECFYFADGNLTWLKDFDDLLIPQYLYYWIQSYEGQKKIDAIAKGTAQKAVPIAAIKDLQFALPDVAYQKKVCAILSAYDDLIENNRRQIKLLEEAAQRLYWEWFVELRFPGHEGVKVVDGVPEGWTIRELNTFGEIITGKTPATSNAAYYGGTIPFVKIPDMHNGVFPVRTDICLTEEGAASQSGKFIPPGSLMVSCIGTVGLVNISYQMCQTNQQINSIVLDDKKNLCFLYQAIKEQKALLEAIGSNGATMTNVNKDKFGKVKVLYPDEYMAQKYNKVASAWLDKIKVLETQIAKLCTTRDKLLPKLMSGEMEMY